MSEPAARGRRRKIGLLGGSFNPAHEGHLHISLLALKRLGLDEVWWLVSPQNPLKSSRDMAPFAERFARARGVARHPKLRVSDLEMKLGTRFTVDTLAALTRRFPRHSFVWIAGADILLQLPDWRDWPRVFSLAAVAVFDRPTYSHAALSGPAAMRFRHARLPERRARELPARRLPAWVFIHGVRHPASATAIRAKHKSTARRGR